MYKCRSEQLSPVSMPVTHLGSPHIVGRYICVVLCCSFLSCCLSPYVCLYFVLTELSQLVVSLFSQQANKQELH